MILYVLVSLYKFFVICFIIHKQQQYKNVNNYYEEISTCINNIANEKYKIWYKDGKYKIEIIRYDDVGSIQDDIIMYLYKEPNLQLTINCLDGKKNEGEMNSNLQYIYYNNSFLFNQLPEFLEKSKLELIIESFFNFSLRIKVVKGNIFLNYNSSVINIKTNNYLPQIFTKNKELQKVIYYNYEFNCITDDDIKMIN